MEETPGGTPVGVDDPYEHVDRCDHLTDDGRCRYALRRVAGDRPGDAPGADGGSEFVRERRADDFACPVVDPDGDWSWHDCPAFRARSHDRECARCGLEGVRMAHEGSRPLLEEHHLSYADGESTSHEITSCLCRWCHAKVHGSWARIDDDAAPDPEAIAAREQRRSRELDELGFESAADRYDG
jgi:hypothetical protein